MMSANHCNETASRNLGMDDVLRKLTLSDDVNSDGGNSGNQEHEETPAAPADASPEKCKFWLVVTDTVEQLDTASRSVVKAILSRLISGEPYHDDFAFSPERCYQWASFIQRLAERLKCEEEPSKKRLEPTPIAAPQPLEFLLDVGTASPEKIGELFGEMTKLYRLLGGDSDLEFRAEECRVPAWEVSE